MSMIFAKKELTCCIFLLFLLIVIPTEYSFAKDNMILESASALLHNKTEESSRKYNTSCMKITTNAYIDFYQKSISPINRNKCVFRPSCSEYMRLAINKFGIVNGVIMGTDRLMRCHSKAFQDKGYQRTEKGYLSDNP